jgi:hypothetical protein
MRPRLGWIVLMVIGAASAAATLWGRSLFWGLFSFAVLFLSLESFYFPTRFLLEEQKVTVIRRFSRSEREWSVFRRCTVDRDGLTLSPFARSSWLEAYRAIRLRFLPGNREAVVAFVRQHLGEGVEWVQDQRWKRDASPT